MLPYIIKSILVLSILYVPYMLLLRKESFFRFNRAMLLGIMLLALLLPLCNIHQLAWDTTPSQPLLTDSNPSAFSILLNEITVLPSAATQMSQTSQQPWWVTTLCYLYLAGMAITLIIKLTQLALLYRHIHRGVLWTDTQDGITLYCHAHHVAPFSWFRSIVISEEDYTHNASTILRHEMGHIQHHHSFDILLLNVCQIIQWANPLAWILGNSLRDVHEYEADDTVLRSGVNIQQYQYLLIKKAVDSSSYAFANSFNHSSLKKRITMMLQKNSNPWMRTKALYLIPVAFVALSAFATPELTTSVSQTADEVTNRDKVTAFSAKDQTLPTKSVETPAPVASELTQTPPTTLISDDDPPIFDVVEEMPVFPGGQEGMMKFLYENFRYPEVAKNYGVQGRVLVEFVVEKDGKCSSFKILKKADDHLKPIKKDVTPTESVSERDYITQEEFETAQKACEDEALRVCGLMSDWTPGKQKGEAVRVRFTLPITFRLK